MIATLFRCCSVNLVQQPVLERIGDDVVLAVLGQGDVIAELGRHRQVEDRNERSCFYVMLDEIRGEQGHPHIGLYRADHHRELVEAITAKSMIRADAIGLEPLRPEARSRGEMD